MKKILLLCLLVSLCVAPFSWSGQGWGKNKDLAVTTMTQNMFPGADLGNILTADLTDENELYAAVQATVDEVLASNIPGRAALVAAEIAENQPDLVALQEATKWKINSGHGMIVLDQLDLLMDALKKAGQHYRVAVVQELTDVQIKGLISYTDHDAILVKTDRPLNVVGSETHLFDAESLLSFSFMGGTIQVLRGWMAVDVKLNGSRFKFVNTHLEAPLPEPPDALAYTQYLQLLQAQQLVSDLNTASLPIILAGDFNSAADSTGQYPADETLSYSLLVAPIQLGGGGYSDPWHELNEADPGYTWPLFEVAFDGTVIPPLIERIDLILAKGPDAVSMKTIGTPFFGLPASDHAGVVAAFQLEDSR